MAELTEPPVTGDARVDHALRAVGGSSGVPLAEQYRRLTGAQAALAAVLAATPESRQVTIPGLGDGPSLPHHTRKA